MIKNELRDLLDREIHVDYDKDFIKRLKRFRLSWSQRGQHVEFLGSTLIGVYKVNFDVSDEQSWFIDLIGVDRKRLNKAVLEIDEIHAERNVQSNLFFLISVYLMYRFINSNLSEKDKESGVYEVGYILSVKMMSSVFNHQFKDFQADIGASKLTYERLSNSFIFKQVDSWHEFIEYRVSDFTHGIFRKKLSDPTIQDMLDSVTGLKTRLNDALYRIYSTYRDIVENKERLDTLGYMSSGEDGEFLKDFEDSYEMNLNRVLVKSTSEDLINEKLVKVMANMSGITDAEDMKRSLRQVIKDMREGDDKVENLIKESIRLSLRYIIKKHGYSSVDLPIIVIDAKNYWLSSRILPHSAVTLKKNMKKYIEKNKLTKSKNKYSNMTIYLILYLFVYSLVKRG